MEGHHNKHSAIRSLPFLSRCLVASLLLVFSCLFLFLFVVFFFLFFFSFFPFLSFFPPPLGFSYFLGGHLADRLRFGPPVMELFSPYLCVADEQNAILQGSIPSWC